MEINRHLIVIFFTIIVGNLFSQTITDVPPGTGTLQSAIAACPANGILQLTGGAEYLLSTSATTFGNIDRQITIQVKPGSIQKAIIKLAPAAPTNKKYYYFTLKDGGGLTLKGLDISGIAQDTAVAGSMIIFDGRPTPVNARFKNFRFEDCVFHDFVDYIVNGMKDDYARGSQMDTVFVSHVTVHDANHFLQYKHVSLHHLEMSNSTIYNMNGMALKIGKIGYRCVLLNPNKPYIPISDETITPTGFIYHCTMNNLGDIHGHVQIDNAFNKLTISNCIISNQQQWNQPAIYLLEPNIMPAVEITNTCFWRCAPLNAEVGGNQWIGYQFKDTTTMNPAFMDPANGDFTLPQNSSLLTSGKEGGSIGDLRWVRNSTGVSSFLTENTRPFNFPNPFRNFTDILYTVSGYELVQLEIFNVNGMKVASLINEKKAPGNYKAHWNSSNYNSGLYFYRLSKGLKTETGKMILK